MNDLAQARAAALANAQARDELLEETERLRAVLRADLAALRDRSDQRDDMAREHDQARAEVERLQLMLRQVVLLIDARALRFTRDDDETRTIAQRWREAGLS